MTRHKKNIPIRIQSAPPHGFTGSISPWKASLSVAECQQGIGTLTFEGTRMNQAPNGSNES